MKLNNLTVFKLKFNSDHVIAAFGKSLQPSRNKTFTKVAVTVAVAVAVAVVVAEFGRVLSVVGSRVFGQAFMEGCW